MLWFKKEYTNLAEANRHCRHIKKLRLSLEDMDHVNASIGAFTSLQSLQVASDVTAPLLSDLSDSLPKLRSLSTLNVLFPVFPDWLLRLRELEYLYLRGYDFTIVPDEIASLSKLKVLRLENMISHLYPNLLQRWIIWKSCH